MCPYCAVGCGQKVFVKDEKVVQIEGDPDSPDLAGPAVPQGQRQQQLVTSSTRETKIRYRRPHGTEWEDLDLDTAMDMIADRVIETRKDSWQGRTTGADAPAGRWASRASAERPSTTRRTTS